MPPLSKVTAGSIDDELRGRITAVLAEGGVIAYPTETYYGLGVSPWSERGVDRLIAIKRERGGKPIPLILASTAAVLRVAAALPPGFAALAERFWPGPLTIVLAARDDLSPAVTAGTGSVAVRVPAHPVARELARIAGGALTSTSANRSGEPPPRTAVELSDRIGGEVEVVIDGGETPGGLASTIVDLTASPPRLLRVGPTPGDVISAVLSVVLG